MKESFAYFHKETEYHSELTATLQPFDSSFEGELYVLIDGDGQSTTGHVMSLIKERSRAILIGEELGSNQFCTANQKRDLKLKNTGISYQVAQTAFFTTVEHFPKDKGIMPDHLIIQSISDFLNNKDTVMDYATQLIRGK
jgi:C-terminal processing protease CtpA/Prc